MKETKENKKIRLKKVLELLAKQYPSPKPELTYKTNFELLVAVILSAQCTDKRVNLVTNELFKKYSTPQDFAALEYSELEKQIKSCGLGASKAKNIVEASKKIIKDYNGEVPNTIEKLQSLPGVGRKTANVVGSVAFNIPAIAVDTHVFRVSNRIGLADAKDVLNTEKQLMKAIPKKDWADAHHWLILHGRRVCTARKPDCQNCIIANYCGYNINNTNEKQ